MRYNNHFATMKEIEDSIIDTLMLDAQLVDAIPQIIRLRPS
jgi:hypothetical protein